MTNPLVIVVGFIGKIPVAGMSLYHLHYIAGLQELGYEVHYVEHLNAEGQCYDPAADVMTENAGYAIGYLGELLPRFGVALDHLSFIDRQNVCHGSGWEALRSGLSRADFVLTICDPAWFDEMERCPRRCFVDGDPLFTQMALLEKGSPKSKALKHYDTLFTYGTRIGMPDCTVPEAGRKWIPTRPVVSTRLWDSTPPASVFPITTVMNWAAGRDVTHDGVVYGHKNREFERFIDLPALSPHPLALAVGGPAPKERLREHGWDLIDPLDVSRSISAYQRFIAASWADFGIAKHAYVQSRSGWFSDRSTCYLAGGRPVLHQETGFSDWLPAGEGVLSFSTMDEAVEAIARLDADYTRHAKAARSIAEEHFEAAKVIGHMLDEAELR